MSIKRVIAEKDGHSIKKFLKPEYLLLVLCLLIGIFFYKNYGISWDEPAVYNDAEWRIKAYSIPDILKGTYDLNSVINSGTRKSYGPAYQLMGKSFQFLIQWMFKGSNSFELWHFTNYMFYLLGCFFLFKIICLFTGKKTAWVSIIFFYTQPLLFGSSWINPKDIPLMVFFTGTMYFGFRFVNSINPQSMIFRPHLNSTKKPSTTEKIITICGITLIVITAVNFIFGKEIEIVITNLISWLYFNSDGNFMSQWFLSVAENISSANLTSYASKTIVWFHRIRFFGFLLVIIFAIWRIQTTFFPNLFKIDGKRLQPQNFLLVTAAILLGLTTSIRVIGPLSGILIAFLAFLKYRWKALPYIFFYGVFAILVAYISWPYIWEPKNFLNAFLTMSDYPWSGSVLFNGTFFKANEVPISYLPVLMLITLTEWSFPLMIIGLVITIREQIKRRNEMMNEHVILLLWLIIPLLYAVILRPAMYDNNRHFLFIIPPLFVYAAIAIEKIIKLLSSRLIQGAFVILLLLPGIFSIIQLHPFEYSYYNTFIGGIKGADGRYEIDYWLLCYKDLMEEINDSNDEVKNIYVARVPSLINNYTDKDLNIHSLKDSEYDYPKESVLILPKRWNDILLYPEYPVQYEIQRARVPFCVGKIVSK